MNRPCAEYVLLLFLFASLFSGCEDTPVTPNNLGTLKISITDAPASFEAVNITFSEISVHTNGEWITVRDETEDPITINLLEWNNGQSIVIGTADVPSGLYTQVRLIILSANIVVNESQHDLFVPSGAQSGLKFGPQFTVQPGTTAELIIDFDVNRSIVVAGPSQDPNKYILKPTIRVIPKALTGSIFATVTNPEHVPVAYAVAQSDTVTSTPVNPSGSFILAFLPEGLYTVSVQDTLGQSFEVENVAVLAGSENNIGSITLY